MAPEDRAGADERVLLHHRARHQGRVRSDASAALDRHALEVIEALLGASDEVVVRVAYAGICGSELSGYLGHNALRVPPLIMGHAG